MKKIIAYINPIHHLGKKGYSFFFPFIVNILLVVLSELYAYGIAKNPMAVGVYIIIINFALIIYFSFRDGLKGGFITIAVTILYYLYIIYTRHYSGDQLSSGIIATIVLSILYLILVLSIGGLKQKIDSLIEKEADEKGRLEAIVQQLPTGIVITDSIGKVIQVNEKMHEILANRIPIGQVIGKNTPFIPNKQGDKTLKSTHSPLYQAIRFGKTQLGKEYKFSHINGKPKYIQISAAPVYNSSGFVWKTYRSCFNDNRYHVSKRT